MSRCLTVALLFVVGCVLPLSAWSQPAPPGQMQKLFRDFLHGEEYIEARDWGSAQAWTEQLRRDMRGLAPLLRPHLPELRLRSFDQSLADLEQALATYDAAHVRLHFLTTHKRFLELFAPFDNRILPSLTLVQNDLQEAEEGLRRHDFQELKDELQESDLFYRESVRELRRRGLAATEIEQFQALLAQTQERLHAGARDGFAEALAELQRRLAAQQKWLAAQ